MTWREEVLGLRAALGWTQARLAVELAVTASTVNRWENGHAEPLAVVRKAFVALAAQHGLRAPAPSEVEILLAFGDSAVQKAGSAADLSEGGSDGAVEKGQGEKGEGGGPDGAAGA